MVAEFETNLNHLCTREGMEIARRKGKLRGKQPKLPESSRPTIRQRYAVGDVSIADLAEEYRVSRSPTLPRPLAASHTADAQNPQVSHIRRKSSVTTATPCRWEESRTPWARAGLGAGCQRSRDGG
jgi:DNA invertase Pin-like site-specific DNA recombinase